MNGDLPEGTGDVEPGVSGTSIGSPVETAPMRRPPVAKSVAAPPAAEPQQEHTIDEPLMRRIRDLPKEAGWALIAAGVVGVIAPGVMGWPFLVAGALVLTPGGPQKLARWAGRKPRKYTNVALRQICRLVDDLDHRYPSVRPDGSRVVVQQRRNLDAK